tara:strand:+ start:395 stop:1156 length:762 start_codon:yes stop_codon:yes gene_type:complete
MNSEKSANKSFTHSGPTLTFICLSCRKQFKYLESFKRHALKPSRPNGCANPDDLLWEVVQQNAQKQIDYYKLPKKEKKVGVCLYKDVLTKMDILDAKKNCNTSIKSIIQPLNGCTMGAISRDNRIIFDLFLKKYKKLGYELLTVEHVSQYSLDETVSGWRSGHYYYLTKDDNVYLLWRGKNGKLTKVGKKINMNVNNYKINSNMIKYEIKKFYLKKTFGFYGYDATYYSHTWDEYQFVKNRNPLNAACKNMYK